jgi:pimeloyl-ACP methyl ester carboxylesterase
LFYKKCIINKGEKALPIRILETAIVLLIISNSTLLLLLFYPPVNALFHQENDRPRPVLLIHGYLSDASVWSKWKDLLKKDGIQFQAVTYKQDDRCGSAEKHASELNQIIEDFKRNTGSEKINIVAHSKGGLDARLYLANNPSNDDVANLIMIGTPNNGSSLANAIDICSPAIEDLRIGAPATNAINNSNTTYHTIAGDWNLSQLRKCLQIEWLPSEIVGYFLLKVREGNNDGIVPISSVESQNYSKSLGHTSSCHSNLLGDDEYKLAEKILNTTKDIK